MQSCSHGWVSSAGHAVPSFFAVTLISGLRVALPVFLSQTHSFHLCSQCTGHFLATGQASPFTPSTVVGPHVILGYFKPVSFTHSPYHVSPLDFLYWQSLGQPPVFVMDIPSNQFLPPGMLQVPSPSAGDSRAYVVVSTPVVKLQSSTFLRTQFLSALFGLQHEYLFPYVLPFFSYESFGHVMAFWLHALNPISSLILYPNPDPFWNS